VNNAQKLDDIRRRIRIIDMRLDILQRAAITVYERLTGGGFPMAWFAQHEQKVLEPGAKLDIQI
jgi:hypothetical protein